MQCLQAAPSAPDNRAMRRRRGRLQRSVQASCSAGVAAGSRERRLETHVWHAKRMSMASRRVLQLDLSPCIAAVGIPSTSRT
jgi:hypothetical protein